MISKFIDRKEELSLLEEEWKKKNGRLIIVYGRRRIGKTKLLTEFVSGKKGIFYIAEDTSPKIQIDGLKEKIAEFMEDNLLKTLEIKDWDQLFGYLARNSPPERFYLLIDEFSYLAKSDKRILSVLQKYWDTSFATSNICILLSGSMLGLMSEMVLSYASPLYGRRSRDILLEGLSFRYSKEFFNMPLQQALEMYMTIGGVPEYLLKASEYTNFSDFVEKEFFNKYGYFYREPYFIISQEFKELKTYFSILNAIAYGNTKPAEIANFSGLNAREIYPYLENLIRLGFIERQVSIIGNPKKGIYLIKDPIFDFWFNFVFKYREEIERGIFNLKNKNELISSFFGKKFEAFVLNEFILNLLPAYQKIGKWWHKDEEIDIVALNDEKKEIVFVECKWSRLGVREATKILTDLKRKANLVKWHNSERKEHYGIIAKTIEEKEILRENGYLAFDLKDFNTVFNIRKNYA
ncbi:MAG TPA: ATP-binding protein [Candidatus Methylomirabilis sp.]|nr:ATP-binding protein [Candidatus Methylomirabilis sp.]